MRVCEMDCGQEFFLLLQRSLGADLSVSVADEHPNRMGVGRAQLLVHAVAGRSAACRSAAVSVIDFGDDTAPARRAP